MLKYAIKVFKNYIFPFFIQITSKEEKLMKYIEISYNMKFDYFYTAFNYLIQIIITLAIMYYIYILFFNIKTYNS